MFYNLDLDLKLNINDEYCNLSFKDINEEIKKIDADLDLGVNYKSSNVYELNDASFSYKDNNYLLYYNENVEVVKFIVKDNFKYTNNDKSFMMIVPIDNIKLNDNDVSINKPYLVEANSSIKLSGNGIVLIIRVVKFGIGLDVGGTNIKGMILDDLGHIVCQDKVPTEANLGYAKIISNMNDMIDKLIDKSNLDRRIFKTVGVGFPGNVDTKKGIVIYSNNISIENAHVKEDLSKLCNMDVKVDNDANLACLGEYMFTNKSKYHDMCLLTLGTGVGSGLIIDSKPFKGGMGSITELGHMKVKSDKIKCTCGQYGCLESLLSLARIKNEVKELIDDHSNGLYEYMSEEDSPLKIFEFDNVNDAAKDFSYRYQNNLLLGLTNICNLFQPEIIVIGGGVSYVISKYLPSLEYRMNKYKYSGFGAPKVKLVQAKLGNDAGSYGACALSLI